MKLHWHRTTWLDMQVRTCRQPNCHSLAPLPHWYCEQHRALEEKYLKSRQKYSRTNDNNYRKRYDKVNRNANEVKRAQVKFYRSKVWQSLRQVVLAKQHHLCQYCLAEGRTTPAKVVDHRVPFTFEPNRSTDIDNLDVICPKCHYKKDQFEDKYYGSSDGFTKNNVTQITTVKLIDYYMNHLNQIPK